MANYQTFAQLYDNLFDGELYLQWRDYVQANVPDKQGKLLDLAGGAGRLAVLLAQAGYQDVSVFDLSPEMLSLAMKHAQEAKVTIPLIEGDMTEWSDLPIQYQTITSFADSFNYLGKKAQLKETFIQVYQHLLADGQFLFDMITTYQIKEVYPGYMYNWHDEETAFLWSSYEGERPNSVEHELTFFVYQEEIDGYQQLQELHYEYAYTLAEIEALLVEVGFKDIEVHADFGQAPVSDTTTRWFFKAHK